MSKHHVIPACFWRESSSFCLPLEHLLNATLGTEFPAMEIVGFQTRRTIVHHDADEENISWTTEQWHAVDDTVLCR